MQRAYCAALTDPLAVDRQELLDCKRRIYLSGIQERLPNISVPQDTVLDNTEVQRIKSAVAEELPGDRWSRNPLERRFCYQLQSCLADDLCATRNPVEAWTSPHAHWLDRIARIEKLLGTNDLARFAGQAVYPYNVRRAYANPSSDIQQQLSEYQALQRWAGLLQEDAFMHLKPCRCLESLKAVREMSAEALAQRVRAEAQKHYSWPVYWEALITPS